MNHPHHIHRFESMIIKNETTLKTDFNNGEIKPKKEIVYYKEKPCCLRKRPPPLKDLQSLIDWKVPNVPFNLFIKPHEILHTNPWVAQEAYHQPLKLDQEDVQKTRPRIIMAPFVSMDDFQGSEDRQRLTQSFYTTEAMRFARKMQEVTSHSNRAPLPTGLPAPANPIYLPRLKAPYISPEWRMDSVSWDNKQVRGRCDAAKEFWMRRPPFKCRLCEETAIVHYHRKNMGHMQSGRRGGHQ